MKVLYLHIGTPKTATSSIQKFLCDNRKILEQHGYCFPKLPHKYPYVSSNRNAHFMLGDTNSPDQQANMQEKTDDLLEGLGRVRDCFKKYDFVILTDEDLWRASSYSRKELFPYLKQEAMQQGYQIKIIVYLRRQDKYLISLWNQNIKRASRPCLQQINDYMVRLQKKAKLVLDYAAKLDSIAELFGKENLIVRRFEPQSWVNHSIIDDFMDCIGLELTDEFQLPSEMANPGLDFNCAEIKRIINNNPMLSVGDIHYLASFLKSLSETPPLDKKNTSTAYSMLSVEETKSLLAKYAEGNERIASEYIHDGKPLFSDDIPDLPKWEINAQEMYENTIHFFSMALARLHNDNESLKKEITKLNKTVTDMQKSSHQFLSKLKRPVSSLFNVKGAN